jgi:hypothetical protein
MPASPSSCSGNPDAPLALSVVGETAKETWSYVTAWCGRCSPNSAAALWGKGGQAEQAHGGGGEVSTFNDYRPGIAVHASCANEPHPAGIGNMTWA